MTTQVITFDFLSNAQSFTANAGSANSTLAWDGANGNPVGCLSSSRAVKANSGDNNSWTRSLTWVTMGIPSGATITAVTGASMQSRCTAFTSAGAGNTSGAVTLVDGATTITLSAQRAISATDTSFVTTNGTDATGLSLSSGDTVTITIPNHLQNSNTTGSTVTLKQDQLTFTVTFTTVGAATGVGTTTGVGASTAVAPGSATGTGTTTAVGASTAAAVGAATGTATVSGSSPVTTSGVGAVTGAGTVSGVGTGIIPEPGSASGAAAVAGVGASIFAAVGVATGTATVTGIAGGTPAVGIPEMSGFIKNVGRMMNPLH